MKSNAAIAASTDEASAATWVWGLSSREAAILAGILLATVAIYLPSLRNGWVFDDWKIFVDNKYIHGWSFIWNSFIHDKFWFHNPAHLPQSEYYRPVENTFIAANAFLIGKDLTGWHLAKILLHIVTVILCFRVAQVLSGDIAVGLLTAAIFGVIPAHVDAVVWVSAISEPLATAFELGALLCLIGRKPGWSRGMLSALALYACAQLTHEAAIAFPAIVAAYVFLIERGANERRQDARRNAWRLWERIIAAVRVSVPFGVIALLYIWIRFEVLGFAFNWPRPVTLRAIAHGQIANTPIVAVDYLLTLPSVLLTDLGVLAVPGIAGPVHDVNLVTRASLAVLLSAGLLLILIAGAVVLLRRSTDRRLYLFCAAWTLLALAPAMKLNSIWAPVQDRYLYTPSFGWSMALALATVQLAAARPRARAAIGTATALLLAAYMVTTMRIEHYWHDDLTFFEQCVAVDPDREEYRRRLSEAMDKNGDFKGAAQELEREVILDPDEAYLHLRLAQEYMRLGRRAEFDREFQKYNELTNIASPPGRAAESPDAAQPIGAP